MWKLTSIVWVTAIFNLICFTVEVQKIEVDSICHAAMFNLFYWRCFFLPLKIVEYFSTWMITFQVHNSTTLWTDSAFHPQFRRQKSVHIKYGIYSSIWYAFLAHLEWFRKFIIRLWHLHSRVCMLLILNHMWFNNWLYLGLVFFNGILEIHLNSLFLILSLCKYINF